MTWIRIIWLPNLIHWYSIGNPLAIGWRLEIGGWGLVAEDWWLRTGGLGTGDWRLVAEDWWLGTGGWGLVAGGWWLGDQQFPCKQEATNLVGKRLT